MGDRIVVARLAESCDSKNRVRPKEGCRFIAGHKKHTTGLEALLHAHGDCAAREVLKVAGDSTVAGGIDRARELVDLEDARV